MKLSHSKAITFSLYAFLTLAGLMMVNKPVMAGTVIGVIREADDVVYIDDAQITGQDSLGNVVGSGLSSDGGRFSVIVGSDVSRLIFTKDGYRDSIINDVVIGPDDTLSVHVILQQSVCRFTLGDANGSGAFNGVDLLYLLRILKGDSLSLYSCECTPGETWNVIADLNNSCSFNGLDIIYGVEYFKGGANVMPCADCPGPNWWARAYLVWDENPRDLDLHLWTPPFGPSPSDSMTAHVCYYRRGSENEPPYAELQLDDVASYGPEQTDIYQGYPGTYVLAAYHYSGQGTIVTSNARASILHQDGTYTIMNVPQDSANANWWWHICEIDGTTGEVTPLNILSHDPPRQDARLEMPSKE